MRQNTTERLFLKELLEDIYVCDENTMFPMPALLQQAALVCHQFTY